MKNVQKNDFHQKMKNEKKMTVVRQINASEKLPKKRRDEKTKGGLSHLF